MHRTTSRFWKYFDNLPVDVQKVARKHYELLKDDPFHPSLRFKKAGKFWSVRAGIHHRALAIEDGEDFI